MMNRSHYKLSIVTKQYIALTVIAIILLGSSVNLGN